MLLKTYDAGSLPSFDEKKDSIDMSVQTRELTSSESNFLTNRSNYSTFTNQVLTMLKDKITAGLDLPNYPQIRDMTEMFFHALEGVQKNLHGYTFTDIPHVHPTRLQIPEVAIIRRHSKSLAELFNRPIRLKICLTGPYTLSTLFARQDEALITLLAELVQKILTANIYSTRDCHVALVTLDEPVLGIIDDPLLDYGSTGREALINAWHRIFQTAKSRNSQTNLHLHNTSNDIFWQVSSLDIIESHVDDPLYTSPLTSRQLNQTDKYLKASIAITSFDTLLHNHFYNQHHNNVDEIPTHLASVWQRLLTGQEPPDAYLESTSIMANRLRKIIKRFGIERVPYAGPECGLKNFPTYAAAIECLRRTTIAAKSIAL